MTVIANNVVEIGADCLIGDMVTIFDSDFHTQQPEARRDPIARASSDGVVGVVTIGENVWIGSRALILRGASIGDDAIVAAGAVVTGPIPARVLAGGVPARMIREL